MSDILCMPEAPFQYGFARRPLGGVLSSCVMDLDATIAQSYRGAGTLLRNIERTPADGSGQTAYNQTLNGLTFTGRPGRKSAYLAADGNDYAVLTGSNTTFLNSLHKTTGGADFTAVICFRHVAAAATQALWTTRVTAANNTMAFYVAADEKVYLTQRGTSSVTPILGGDALSNATDYCIIVAHSHANNRTRLWQNSRTALEVTHTFNTSTTDAGGKLSIGALADGFLPLQNGARLYHFSLFNEEFDNTKAGKIYNALNRRHNRTYA